jgi:hypothetical protein
MAAAAAVLEFNQMLERIGFAAQARAVMTDPDRENIQLVELRLFTDDRVKTLCHSLRKGGTAVAPVVVAAPPPPGGAPVVVPIVGGRRGRPVGRAGRGAGAAGAVVAAGVAAGAAAVAAAPNHNLGVYVSTRAESNLMVACYIARHFHRTNRTLEANMIDQDRIERYEWFKQAEKDYKEPTELMKLAKVEKIQDFIDDFPDHLYKYNGQGGRPLSYIIRELADIPDEDDDPPFGDLDTEYTSLRDEVAARASLAGDHYAIDNARVFQLLNDAIVAHPHVKAWIKDYQRRRNGRDAWLAFRTHYRGQSEMETIQVQAEQRLDTLRYHGEKARYNFETHVSNHRKAHNDILKASGTPLQETVKVRKLTTSLMSTDLKTAKSTIAAIENLRTNFDDCVNYLKGQLTRSNAVEERQVSAAGVASGSNKNKRKGDDKGKKNFKKGKQQGGGKGLDRWYNFEEYKNFSDSKKKAIEAARAARKAAKVATEESSSSGTSQRQSSDTKLQKDDF